MTYFELIQVLESTAKADKNLLSQATEYLKQSSHTDFALFVTNLSSILKDTKLSDVARLQAALQLKNQVYSKDHDVCGQYKKRWLALSANIRNAVKTNCLEALGTEQCRPSQAAQCVGAIALCEIPSNQWLEVIDLLVNKVISADDSHNASTREASLEAIGYICHDIPVELLSSKSNEILTAIIHGMSAQSNDANVRLAATNALLNSLEFTSKNFEVESERNYIMQVVCESTQYTDQRVQVVALQVLVRIVDLFYRHMHAYMEQALFAITQEAIRSNSSDISLQGIEFWSTICDEEIDIISEIDQARILDDTSKSTSNRHLLNFVTAASRYLVPDLLEKLKQQEEGDDEDEWNPCKSAGVCLSLMAEISGDQLIEPVMTFVNYNIGSTDWRFRDAAIVAFGSIVVETPGENLLALADHAPSALLPMMNDSCLVVRDSVAWSIGRLCDHIPAVCLSDKYLNSIVEVMMVGLDDKPRVAHNVCWALKGLLEAAAREGDADSSGNLQTFKLSSHFRSLVDKLLVVSERPDGNENNLRNASYETISAAIRTSAKDCYETIKNLTQILLSRLELLSDKEHNNMSNSDKNENCEIQAMLCASLQAIIPKLTVQDCKSFADRFVMALIRILSSPMSAALGSQEDAICALSLLCSSLRQDFVIYVHALMPFILTGLTNHAFKQSFIGYIGLYGDICRQITDIPTSYADNVMEVLFKGLADPSLDMELRPQILSLVGDIASMDAVWFTAYIPTIMAFLQQAATANIDTTISPELWDHKNALYEGCIMAMTGIVQGIIEKAETAKGHLQQPNQLKEVITIQPYVEFMIGFIIKSTEDFQACTDELIRAAIGLIGDLVRLFKSPISSLVRQSPVVQLLTRGKKSRLAYTRQLANWTTEEISKCLTPTVTQNHI